LAISAHKLQIGSWITDVEHRSFPCRPRLAV